MEHLFFESGGVRLLSRVKLGAVKYTFPAGAGRTYIPAGVAADALRKFSLEVSELFLRAHPFDPLYLLEAVCIQSIGRVTDLLIEDHMFFALADVAAFQHCILVGYLYISVKGLHGQLLAAIGISGTFYIQNAVGLNIFNLQLSLTAYTDDIGLFPVYTVLSQ